MAEDPAPVNGVVSSDGLEDNYNENQNISDAVDVTTNENEQAVILTEENMDVSPTAVEDIDQNIRSDAEDAEDGEDGRDGDVVDESSHVDPAAHDASDASASVVAAGTDESYNLNVVNTIDNIVQDVVGTEQPQGDAPPTQAAAGGDETCNKIQETDATGQDFTVDPYAKSPEPKAEATATVKFVLMPSGQVATIACSLNQEFALLKSHFATELKMPVSLILIMFEGKTIPDTMTLSDLGVGPNGTVQLEMQSADPVNTPIRSYRPQPLLDMYHTMPDILTVKVPMTVNEFKTVTIEIVKAMARKPFLGGFRHKLTNIEYHNASTMTMKKQRGNPPFERFSRDSQTVSLKHKQIQTRNNMSTQMTKIGVFVSNETDKLVIPGKYTTAAEIEAMKLSKVLIIQKYYRRWLAVRKVKAIRQLRDERLAWEHEQELKKIAEKNERLKDEFNRRMNPKCKADFDLLYAALERWRLEELKTINDTLTGAERKAALYMLMLRETELITAIGRHHNESSAENSVAKIQEFLKKAAAPKRWKCEYDGKMISVDTPYTIRARELQDIYNSINMKYLTQDERLDVLLTLKHTVKEHDCKLTQEIIQLIDREADLLMRGVKETNLEGLRKRIATLFLQYIKTPTFNPEAAPLLRVPQDPSELRNNVRYCPGCSRYLYSTDFPMTTTTNKVKVCKLCIKLINDGQARHDYSHYRYMLKRLRKNEGAIDEESRIAFLMQDDDMRYLVDSIWNSCSALSGWDDMFDLIMVRWDRRQEWSPWNCILLTRDEAQSHNNLNEIDEGYEPLFIHKIQQKHVLARNYFSRLPGMAEHVREKLSQRHMSSGPAVSGRNIPSHIAKA